MPTTKGGCRPNTSCCQTVIKLAKAGSPAAEPLADKYMREQIVNE